MSHQSSLADRAALSLIADDAKLFLDLALNPRLKPIRPIAIQALMPFLSAFLYETVKYVRKRNPEALPDLRSHQELLRASRMRMKLLDGAAFEDILADADELVPVVKELFMRDHRGILGRLKRLLQQDLGVFFMQDQVICTNHVAMLNFGIPNNTLSALSLESLGPYLRDEAEGFGADARRLLEELGLLSELDLEGYSADGCADLNLPPIRFRDLKSERFYGEMAAGVAPSQSGVCVLLTLILSQVNTARVLVPWVGRGNEVASFKIRFVALFHAVSSLQSLLNKDRNNSLLHNDATLQIKATLSERSVRSVRKKSSLRNSLVHYGIDERAAARLAYGTPLFGLVEASAGGKSMDAVAEDVGLGLDRVSDGLHALLPRTLTPEGVL